MFLKPVDDQEMIRAVQSCKKITCPQITMIFTCLWLKN